VAEAIPPWVPRAFGLIGRLAPGLAARAAAELLTRPRGRNPPQPWESEPSPLVARDLVLPGGLHALSWGISGPVVLAQHGWRGRPTQFARLAGPLVQAGYRVVAVDAPGHGRSRGARATPRLVAEALVTAAATLGDIRALVGHSLGGAAAAIALEFGLPARRLVMLGSPSRPSRMIAVYADQIRLPAPARMALDRWFETHAGRPVGRLDPVSLPPRRDVDALVIHDRDDDVIPVSEAQLLQQAWPAARFVYTTGLGHRELLADPAVIRLVAGFVAEGQLVAGGAQPAVDARPADPASRAGKSSTVR
jgi:pimeloyl-ACP methyl ester carboxylesterase